MLDFQAAILTGYRTPLVIDDVSLRRSPGAGEVLVQMKASGICMSDDHHVQGIWNSPTPIVLGHEGAGVVVEVGPGVVGLEPGDRVVMSWTRRCGRCRQCLTGRPAICDVAKKPAHPHRLADGSTALTWRGSDLTSLQTIGTFGQYALVDQASAVRLDVEIPYDQACLIGCAVTTGVGAVTNTIDLEAGASVAVIGCGGVGLNVIAGARLRSAHPIIAIDRSEDRLRAARRMGATHVVLASPGTSVVDAVRDLSGGRGVDVAFEAVGATETIEASVEMIGAGGAAVIAGQVGLGVKATFDPLALSDNEKRIVGSTYGSSVPPVDFNTMARLAVAGHLDIGMLVTRRIALADVNDGLASLRDAAGIRTVIDYDL